MGLSNYLSSSRIAQAGVIPDTANRPASPYEGQMLYQKDTNQVLVYDGSAWVAIADTDQPPGLQLIKTQIVGTAVSTVPVNDVFSSDYDNYHITWAGGTQSADTNLRCQLGSTITGYYSFLSYGNNTSGTPLGVANSNADWFNFVGGGNTNAAMASFELIGPNLAKRTFCNAFVGGYSTVHGHFAGYEASTTQHTSFTLFPASGTMTGGTIRVYGYRN